MDEVRKRKSIEENEIVTETYSTKVLDVMEIGDFIILKMCWVSSDGKYESITYKSIVNGETVFRSFDTLDQAIMAALIKKHYGFSSAVDFINRMLVEQPSLLDFLPRHKHDFETIDRLKQLQPIELKPILPELLSWTEDINWPIAPEVCKLIISCGADAIPHVKKVLCSRDDTWKYFCLQYLVKQMPFDLFSLIREDVERIAFSPTEGERLEDADGTAREILVQFTAEG